MHTTHTTLQASPEETSILIANYSREEGAQALPLAKDDAFLCCAVSLQRIVVAGDAAPILIEKGSHKQGISNGSHLLFHVCCSSSMAGAQGAAARSC